MDIDIKNIHGRLGVLIVGLGGAVSTTFTAGVFAVRKGLAKPIGSLTQLDTLPVGEGCEVREPLIKDVVPLASLDDLCFGGWDLFPDNQYEAALHAQVLSEKDIERVREDLEQVVPMRAAFDPQYVKRLHGTWVMPTIDRAAWIAQIRDDIRSFKRENGCDRMVVIWAASTEIFVMPSEIHQCVESLEQAIQTNDERISPSLCYAYAAISEGVPFVNGAPNLTLDFPAMIALAEQHNVPIAGKDFKTGQTLMKTTLAPMLKRRMLGLEGWFSTNILGNRDGEVLDDPMSFKTKEESKLSVFNNLLDGNKHPELYGDIYHKVRINYYPPRRDNKEGWDNIDLFGWLGYPMQLKIDFLCRDSILAAPLCLDLVLFVDLAQRCGFSGVQRFLSFYFKSPMTAQGESLEHDLFVQHVMLKNKLRDIIGEKTYDYLD